MRDFLLKRGIDASRLEAVGFGRTRPLVQGEGEEARESNRRVDFLFLDLVDLVPSDLR